jgi:hypothetical protein
MAINPAVNAPFSALPAPLVWSVDANGQSLAYVYGHADQRDAQIANALTLDEARRPAVGPLLFYCVKTEVPSSHVVAMMPRKSH